MMNSNHEWELVYFGKPESLQDANGVKKALYEELRKASVAERFQFLNQGALFFSNTDPECAMKHGFAIEISSYF